MNEPMNASIETNPLAMMTTEEIERALSVPGADLRLGPGGAWVFLPGIGSFDALDESATLWPCLRRLMDADRLVFYEPIGKIDRYVLVRPRKPEAA